MELLPFEKLVRGSRRFNEILGILGRYGLADWLQTEDAFAFLKERLRGLGDEDLSKLSREERIRLAITELGPTFIKLGQVLSTRSDVIPPALAAELEKLQADTPADSPEVVRETVEAELGRPLAECFAEFDLTAMASASIGQVHAATLHAGERAVVKVQHAGIRGKIEEDLEILGILAAQAERLSAELRQYQPRALLAEFRRSLLRELDFGRELHSLQRFIQNFADDATVHIPRPDPELSAARVLTMERLEGTPLSKAAKLREQGVDLQDVAKRGVDIFVEMIFRDGIYHADPHPGNIWVLPGQVIGLLDFGMTGRVDEASRDEFVEFLLAIVQSDLEGITESVIRLGSPPRGLDREALSADLGEWLDEHPVDDLEHFDISSAMNDAMAVIRRHRIVLRPTYSMLIKMLVQLEGTSRLLDRGFDIFAQLKPHLFRAAQRRFSPTRMAQRATRSLRQSDRLMDQLPRTVLGALERIDAGDFEVGLELRRLDTTVNRLISGIVTAALILTAGTLLGAQLPPRLGGVSLLGLGALGAALAVGLPLALAVRRSGGMRRRE